MHKAIGDRLTCIFVDNGLSARGGGGQVADRFRNTFPAADLRRGRRRRTRFLAALTGVTDPEEKRQAIGAEFIEVFEDAAKKVGSDVPRPGHAVPGRDRERCRSMGRRRRSRSTTTSAGCRTDALQAGRAAARAVQGRSAAVGLQLGLPEDLVWRQPFPGPGLAVRVLGEITARAAGDAAQADAIVQEEIKARAVPGDVAGVRGAAAGAERRRDGRRAHLRERVAVRVRRDATTS